jgi:hypothetical protein
MDTFTMPVNKMDTLDNYRKIVKNIISKHTEVPYSYGDLHFETVFDNESDRYLLMVIGRFNKKRVHSCLIHINIIDNQFWIQRDGTENGIAHDLLEAGIPKDKIILAYRSLQKRKDSGLAVGY